MSEQELRATVPAAPDPLEEQMAQMRRWLEGYVDGEGTRHPGLIEMVGVLFEELKTRRERREAIGRALASGGILAVVGVSLAWLKDHIKL